VAPARTALLCAAAAVVVAGAAALFTIGFADWEPSILVRVSESEPMAEVARFHDPDFALVPGEGHFDGVYFYAIALDPFARNNDIHTRIDRYQYRYGHPGFGWLSRMFSLGGIRTLPLSMLVVALAGMGLAGWAVSRIAVDLGRSAWWGMTIAINPGLVLSVTLLTSEPVGVGLAAAGVLAWFRRRAVLGAALMAAACLVKEPFAAVPIGLGAWEIVQMVRHRGEPGVGYRVALLMTSLVPLAWWYLYLRFHLGVFPFREAPDLVGTPLAGWYESLRRAVDLSRTGGSQIGVVAVTAIVIGAAVILTGVARAVRLRSPFDLMFLVLVVPAFFYSWLLLLYPKDLIRELVILSVLLPAVVGSVSMNDDRSASAQQEQ
jgi:hypothetical protein